MSGPSAYARLPQGVRTHPPDCVCRLHEQGIWAGFNPLGGSLVLPNSTQGRQVRERLERRFRLRFVSALGPVEWNVAANAHRGLTEREQEARWRRGNATLAERRSRRFRQGAGLGRWPGEPGQGGSAVAGLVGVVGEPDAH